MGATPHPLGGDRVVQTRQACEFDPHVANAACAIMSTLHRQLHRTPFVGVPYVGRKRLPILIATYCSLTEFAVLEWSESEVETAAMRTRRSPDQSGNSPQRTAAYALSLTDASVPVSHVARASGSRTADRAQDHP